MRMKKFGRTGLIVSEICLGTMTFGGDGFWKVVGEQGQGEADAIVKGAIDAGVNFIDTANVYSNGQSEAILGQAIKNLGLNRDQIVVATKLHGRMGPGPNEVGQSRASILSAIDKSLKRLQLDHIDLYQTHGYDPLTPIEETMEALNDVVRAGKVRYVGFCNLPAWKVAKANAYAAARGFARYESAQVYYTIAGRDIEREIVPLAKEDQLAIMPWARRSPAACSRASSCAMAPARRARAAPSSTSRWSTRTALSTSSKRWSPSPRRMASRSPASRSPGCCTRATSPRSSSAPRRSISSATTSPPPR
mgnify:CR=1 FL=1